VVITLEKKYSTQLPYNRTFKEEFRKQVLCKVLSAWKFDIFYVRDYYVIDYYAPDLRIGRGIIK